MQHTPNSMRPHIVLTGRCNAGKSALMNALTRRETSLVADTPGTTTDPVRRGMEWRPFGPVLMIDTAGLEDNSPLGGKRAGRTWKALESADLVLLLIPPGVWGRAEQDLLATCRRRGLPVLPLFSQADRGGPDPSAVGELAAQCLQPLAVSSRRPEGLEKLRQEVADFLLARAPRQLSPLEGLVQAGDRVVLVMPQDSAAPAGRLIMPQARVLRELLDRRALALSTDTADLPAALDCMREPPQLVLCDSQALASVARDTPAGVPLSTFSVLFARLQGDLAGFARGARAARRLREGDRVLIAEACAHHPTEEDIARVKLPRWLEECNGVRLRFEHCRGHDFPADPAGLALAVHCGACTLNPAELRRRQAICEEARVPLGNFGTVIAALHGLLERVLAPFPESGTLLEDQVPQALV